MYGNITYVLLHSPLVGPLTWELVRREMEKLGIAASVPTLVEDPNSAAPYWQQHVESFAQSLKLIPHDQKIVLVAHSGAGPLLPALRRLLPHSIEAYIFVDAGIPRHNASRLDLMKLEDPAWAEDFRQTLMLGELFPTWSEDDLKEVIPDDILRRRMTKEIKPRSLAFFTESIPVFESWPDSACAYIKLSTSYDWDFMQARQAGWKMQELNAGHFHMLVDPSAVTDLIINAVRN